MFLFFWTWFTNKDAFQYSTITVNLSVVSNFKTRRSLSHFMYIWTVKTLRSYGYFLSEHGFHGCFSLGFQHRNINMLLASGLLSLYLVLLVSERWKLTKTRAKTVAVVGKSANVECQQTSLCEVCFNGISPIGQPLCFYWFMSRASKSWQTGLMSFYREQFCFSLWEYDHLPINNNS